ncbi:hypothetical protein VNI00_006064 [Paramarasmius palmivorus]|uniref:Uncharacterized protein n=1 Tax=Paramarasmius palmivorus TaxID=297713 RepID=A0AAW0DH11_9AGAR
MATNVSLVVSAFQNPRVSRECFLGVLHNVQDDTIYEGQSLLEILAIAMKYTSVLTALAFAATVFAQKATIGEPYPWDTIRAGQVFDVRVDAPDAADPNSNVQHLHLTIAVKACQYPQAPDEPCYTNDNDAGYTLYDGEYQPVHDSFEPNLPPHETFWVWIPKDYPLRGNALIQTTHVVAINVSEFSLLQMKSLTGTKHRVTRIIRSLTTMALK